MKRDGSNGQGIKRKLMTFREDWDGDSLCEELPVENPERNIVSENATESGNALALNTLISDANYLKSKRSF